MAVAESLFEADEEDEADAQEAGESVVAEKAGTPTDAEAAARLADTQPLPVLSSASEGHAVGGPESLSESEALDPAATTGTLASEAGSTADGRQVPVTQPCLPADSREARASTAAPPHGDAPLEELFSAIGTESGETTVEVPALVAADAEDEVDPRATAAAESDRSQVFEASTDDREAAAGSETTAEGAPRPKPTYTVWSSSD